MIYLATLQETTDDKLHSYCIIKTKDDLCVLVADTEQANKVIIRQDFVSAYFTPSGLLAFIDEVRTLNKSLVVELDKTYDVITPNKFIQKLGQVRTSEELLVLASKYPKETLDSLKGLIGKRNQSESEFLIASSQISNLHSTIDEQQKEIDDLKYMLRIEQENKYYVSARLSSLVGRINYQYNVGIDESKLFSVDKNNFDKVIYIKEVTRIQYVDSFIYYLKEILKVLYNMPTRLVVIEPSYATGKPELYPDLAPHYALKERDIISGDIVMLGLQPRTMQDILRNGSNVAIIIILDRSGYKVPYVKGNNVEYMYTVSDIGDISDSIPRSRIISYNKDTLFIPYVKGFSSMDSSKRISTYSKMQIIKQVISTIEGG